MALSNRKIVFSILIQVVIFLVLTLPFHYVLSEPAIYLKKTPSFARTFLGEEEVLKILEEYHNATASERLEAEADPLVRNLTEDWRIYEVNGQVFYERRAKE